MPGEIDPRRGSSLGGGLDHSLYNSLWYSYQKRHYRAQAVRIHGLHGLEPPLRAPGEGQYKISLILCTSLFAIIIRAHLLESISSFWWQRNSPEGHWMCSQRHSPGGHWMYVRGALQMGNPIWITVRSAIGGQVDQPGIDQRPAHSEVIQVLMPQAERPSMLCTISSKKQPIPQPRKPSASLEAAAPLSRIPNTGGNKTRDHTQPWAPQTGISWRRQSIRPAIPAAGGFPGRQTAIARCELVELQASGSARRSLPEKIRVHRLLQLLF